MATNDSTLNASSLAVDAADATDARALAVTVMEQAPDYYADQAIPQDVRGAALYARMSYRMRATAQTLTGRRAGTYEIVARAMIAETDEARALLGGGR